MILTGAITSFRDDFYFLSNYYTAPFTWRGVVFQSGEQAFAYAKTFFATSKMNEYQADILNAKTPGDAKKLGRRCPIDVDEWDKNKVGYMREIVHAKFMTAGNDIVGKLIRTGATMLIEGNDWGDKFWGRVQENGKWTGLNTLGVILMEERGWWSRNDEGRPSSNDVNNYVKDL